ncbi:antitoxin VbhA family protein [Clostridium arbusti]|uniref:antitoxin VbhA family protein n=1 Tax=Clostridium arbusti TaxID=1137848 RepID=UPI000288702D|nr:antitoxin VbhA family protein [Clostridium arbusti]
MGESKERIEYLISALKTMQAMAGLYVTDDEEELLRQYLKGNLSEEELDEIIKKQLNNTKNNND